MSIVEPAEYTTQQQEEDKKFTGVNEFGNVISTLGQIGMMGLALGAAGGFGRGKGSRGPKGMGKPRISTTGVPQSQFSASGMGRKSVSSPMSPSERVAQIGLTRSARNPYGPLKVRSDPVGDFAKRLGRQAGKAASATKRAAAGVAKKVKGQYRKLTADPFKGTNVFAGKGPNEMREAGPRRIGPTVKPRVKQPLSKSPASRPFVPERVKQPLSKSPAAKAIKPKLPPRKPLSKSPAARGVPTPFTQAGYAPSFKPAW